MGTPSQSQNTTRCLGSFPGQRIENINFFVVSKDEEKTWTDWTSDNIKAGLGDGIRGIVSGILVYLSQFLIQTVTDKVRGDTVKDEKLDTEHQSLKIATMVEDCGTLIDSAGNVKKETLTMLAKIQEKEPNLHPIFLSGVIKCQVKTKQQIMQQKQT